MSDPISSLLQRSLSGANNARGTDSASKAEKAGKVTPDAVTNTTTNATPVDQLDVSYLDEKAGTIARILDNISDSVSNLRETQGRLGQITALLEQAGGIAVRARDTIRSTADTDSLKAKLDDLSTRFAKVLSEIDAVAQQSDTSPNLLQNESLTTNFDSNGRVSSETPGIFIGSAGLGLYPINYSEATAEDADATRAAVTTALDEIKLYRQQLGSDLNLLQTRQDFSLNAMQLFATTSDAPVLPSSAEESANLLALQLRQQLSGNDFTLANDQQRALLQQF